MLQRPRCRTSVISMLFRATTGCREVRFHEFRVNLASISPRFEEKHLVPLGMSQCPARALVRVRRGITADTALRLARYFDTTPELWLNLQAFHDLRMAQAKVRPYYRAPGEATPGGINWDSSLCASR